MTERPGLLAPQLLLELFLNQAHVGFSTKVADSGCGSMANFRWSRERGRRIATIPSVIPAPRITLALYLIRHPLRLIFHSFESQLADNMGVTEGKGSRGTTNEIPRLGL